MKVSRQRPTSVWAKGCLRTGTLFGVVLGLALCLVLWEAHNARAQQFEWVRVTLGTNNTLNPRGGGVDAVGNGFVAGTFDGRLDFGETNVLSRGQWDCFLAKYDATGRFQWLRTMGSTNSDYVWSILVDDAGN